MKAILIILALIVTPFILYTVSKIIAAGWYSGIKSMQIFYKRKETENDRKKESKINGKNYH